MGFLDSLGREREKEPQPERRLQDLEGRFFVDESKALVRLMDDLKRFGYLPYFHAIVKSLKFTLSLGYFVKFSPGSFTKPPPNTKVEIANPALMGEIRDTEKVLEDKRGETELAIFSGQPAFTSFL